MKKFKLYTDVLYVHVYDVEAEDKQEAINMVQNEDILPSEVRAVTSPIVTYVRDSF